MKRKKISENFVNDSLNRETLDQLIIREIVQSDIFEGEETWSQRVIDEYEKGIRSRGAL
jgi:hypothetical protein